MKRIQIPKDGYWHCQIMTQDSMGWPVNKFDMSYETLKFEIVERFKNGQPFIVEGKRISSPNVIKTIKIVHSKEKNSFYGTRSLSSEHVFVLAPSIPRVFEEGEDWTTRLLYTEEDRPVVKKTKKGNAATIININQTQSQTQQQKQNISIENIQELQDVFADFREEYKKLPGVDDTVLKEAQDALDELSGDSSPSQRNKVLNKLRRIIKNAGTIIYSVGESAGKVLSTFETLKKIYRLFF